jgi:hypothetical protein
VGVKGGVNVDPRMHDRRPFAVALILSLCLVSASQAGALHISGTVNYDIKHLSDQKLSADGLVLSRDQLTGTIKSTPPGDKIDGSIQTCIGAMVLKAGKAISGNGYCDTVDADGHVWWLTWSAGSEKSNWTVVGGTGKYLGLSGSGTTFSIDADLQSAASTTWPQGYVGDLNFK